MKLCIGGIVVQETMKERKDLLMLSGFGNYTFHLSRGGMREN
ncbi:MAG: hypothetical protein PHE73_05795 [Sulfurovaceae bacterium]|nr:hypothetical protein [Sulfurovaceae bacterium]